jgi:flagellar protein FlaG
LHIGGIKLGSGVIPELILFIAAILVAGMVSGALYVTTQNIAGEIENKGLTFARDLKIDFAIINDPENIPLVDNNTYYVFYIKNTGKESFLFSSNNVVVLIDGEIVDSSNLVFDNLSNPGLEVLNPYEIGELRVNATVVDTSVQYHKITIIVENGKKRSLVFKV